MPTQMLTSLRAVAVGPRFQSNKGHILVLMLLLYDTSV